MGHAATANDPVHWPWDTTVLRKFFRWSRRHWGVSLHVCMAIAVAGIALSFVSIRQSAPAQLALAQAQSNSMTRDMLGEPLRQGLFVTGMVDHVQSGQYADLRMNLYGPKGQGILYANAVKMHGVWQLTSLDLAVDSRPGRVNLLPVQSTIPR